MVCGLGLENAVFKVPMRLKKESSFSIDKNHPVIEQHLQFKSLLNNFFFTNNFGVWKKQLV